MNKKNLIFSGIFSVLITAMLLTFASFKTNHQINNLANTHLSNPINQNEANIGGLLAPKSYNEYLSEKGEKLIYSKLMMPLNRKLNVKVKSKMFSRCPSGLQYYMEKAPSEDAPFFSCILENYSGCEGRKVCNFRLNAAEDNIEIFDEKVQKYVLAENWVSAQTKSTLEFNNLKEYKYEEE